MSGGDGDDDVTCRAPDLAAAAPGKDCRAEEEQRRSADGLGPRHVRDPQGDPRRHDGARPPDTVVEGEGRALLDALGIGRPPGAPARTPEEAERTARDLLGGGNRVVLKLRSPAIPHKSDVGAVRPPEGGGGQALDFLLRLRGTS